MKNWKRSTYFLLGIFLLCGLLNLIAWLSPAFCDAYLEHVFPVISAPLMRLSALLPFSLGFALTIGAIVLVLVGLPVVLILLLVKKQSRRRTLRITKNVVLWIAAYVLLTETLNCFMLYHCTPFGETQFQNNAEITDAEMLEAYAWVADELLWYQDEVPRDADGCMRLDGFDFAAECRACMQKLGETYPAFSGYYPPAKEFLLAGPMRYTGTIGVYIPYTMESNYTPLLSDAKRPTILCHEYAHLKGCIREDEANYIAFLACMQSENPMFRYSGLLAVMEEFMDAGYALADANEGTALAEEIQHRALSLIYADVYNDMYEYYNRAALAAVKEAESAAPEILTDAYQTAGDVENTVMETSLKLNGVSDGYRSYGQVVTLVTLYHREQIAAS